MNIDIAQTAAPQEWAYTLLGVVTLSICLRLWWLTRRDRFWQREESIAHPSLENSAALAIARGHVEDISINVVLQCVVVVLGIAAMITPPTTSGSAVTPLGLAFASGLIAIEVLLAWKAVRNYNRRAAILRNLLKAGWDGRDRRKDALAGYTTEQLEAEVNKRRYHLEGRNRG